MREVNHVAIIMDGNGRWAKERSRPRVWGHIRGSGIVSDIVEEADELGVKALTLYAFSTENWSRPTLEIRTLFKLLKKFLIKERPRILKNNIRFRVMGRLEGLPKDTVELINKVENESRDNTGLKLTFAFGYGGRNELVDGINSYIRENPGEEVTTESITEHLYVPDLGDVDILIRTGGDQRISNFLLWQVAYAELFFIKEKWPDFTPAIFRRIIRVFQGIERRFGSLDNDGSLDLAESVAKERLETFNKEHGE